MRAVRWGVEKYRLQTDTLTVRESPLSQSTAIPSCLHQGPASKNLKAVSGGGIILRTRHIPTRSGLPLTAATTSLRLSKGGASRVFRVILQPGLGCCVGFGCTHNIETGDAGQVGVSCLDGILSNGWLSLDTPAFAFKSA